MNINLKQLQALVWVADLGSFRKAAERLSTTQPNISSRISALENALSVILLERDAGSVRVTAMGHRVLEHARQVLKATDDLFEATKATNLLNGVLRLGVTELIVQTWLHDFLKALKDRYPKIAVELTVDLAVHIEKELFDRGIDLALQSGPMGRHTTGNEELGSYPIIWVASPALNLSSRRGVSIEDLSQHPILTHARGTLPYKDVVEHFASRRDLSARLVPSSNLAATVQMTINGLGAATLPAAIVADELRSGQLVKIDYAWAPQSLDFQARYHAETAPSFVVNGARIAAGIARAHAQSQQSGRS